MGRGVGRGGLRRCAAPPPRGFLSRWDGPGACSRCFQGTTCIQWEEVEKERTVWTAGSTSKRVNGWMRVTRNPFENPSETVPSILKCHCSLMRNRGKWCEACRASPGRQCNQWIGHMTLRQPPLSTWSLLHAATVLGLCCPAFCSPGYCAALCILLLRAGIRSSIPCSSCGPRCFLCCLFSVLSR